MTDSIRLQIDGRSVEVPPGTTLLEAAALLGIEIPAICYHPNLTANGLCRICSVETGGRLQAAACVTPCSAGMVVDTRAEEVARARRVILEMLASTVNLEEAPEILALIQEYEADVNRFRGGAVRQSPVYDDNPFYLRDYNQCVNCWRCVQVCAEDAQFAYALSFDGRGFNTGIGTFQGDGMLDTTCVFCGQCVGVCPTGALKPIRQSLLEAGLDPDEIFRETHGRRRPKRSGQKEAGQE